MPPAAEGCCCRSAPRPHERAGDGVAQESLDAISVRDGYGRSRLPAPLIEHDMSVARLRVFEARARPGREAIAGYPGLSPDDIGPNLEVWSRPPRPHRQRQRERFSTTVDAACSPPGGRQGTGHDRGRRHLGEATTAASPSRASTLTVGAPGEPVCPHRPNGAGKSTTLKGIRGPCPWKPAASFRRAQDQRRPGHEIVGAGICESPGGPSHLPAHDPSRKVLSGVPIQRQGGVADIERVFELFPRLADRITQKAGTMSGGEQQMLADGPGAMAPVAAARRAVDGLRPGVVDLIFEDRDRSASRAPPILLVEQNGRSPRCASPTTPTCSSPAPQARGSGSGRAHGARRRDRERLPGGH